MKKLPATKLFHLVFEPHQPHLVEITQEYNSPCADVVQQIVMIVMNELD